MVYLVLLLQTVLDSTTKAAILEARRERAQVLPRVLLMVTMPSTVAHVLFVAGGPPTVHQTAILMIELDRLIEVALRCRGSHCATLMVNELVSLPDLAPL